MKFKGWDWTELTRVWGAEWKHEDSDAMDDADTACWIRSRIMALQYEVGEVETKSKPRLSVVDKHRIANCRAFVAKVGSINGHTDSAFFTALSEIKDDNTFLFYLGHLLECMWT